MINEAYMPIPLVNRKGDEELPISSWEEREYGGKRVLVFPTSGLVSPLFPGDIRTVGLQFGADYATILYTDQQLGKSSKVANLRLNLVDGIVLPSYSLG